MDLGTLTRFESRPVDLVDGVMPTLYVTPVQGPMLVLNDDEALAVESFLEEQTRPFPMLTMAPGLLDREPLGGEPEAPSLSDLTAVALATLQDMAEARRESAALNVLQRLRRFIFGGAR